jgi:glycine/D-amino acid oxidase-like deaminating enzyme
VSYRAGALYPYRLVTAIWNSLLESFPDRLTLLPNTPATGIATDPSSPAPYLVHTNTATTLRTSHVIHATNAFSAHLLPPLRGRLSSALAHMTSQRPGPDFPSRSGRQSWSVIYDRGFEYVTQRPPRADGSPGDVMLGGGWSRSKHEGLDMLGEFDDGRTETFTVAYLLGIFGSLFPRWGGPGDAMVWTGCIGITGDRLPFVGRLDPAMTGRKAPAPPRNKEEKKGADDHGMQSPGEWISAGYNGEGMVFAWLCGVALGMMILGRDQIDQEMAAMPSGRLEAWFPRELRVSGDRLKGAALKNLVDDVV